MHLSILNRTIVAKPKSRLIAAVAFALLAAATRVFFPLDAAWSADLDTGPKSGFVVFQRSVMKRIMPQASPLAGETPPPLHLGSSPTLQPGSSPTLHVGSSPTLHLEAAWDQREAAQIGVHALRDLEGVTISASALTDGTGHTIPASAIDLRMERFYALPLSVKEHNRIGVVPKTLEPVAPLAIAAGSTRPYWITVHVPDGVAGGTYRGAVTVSARNAHTDVPLEVDVLPRRLLEADAMMGPWSVPVVRNYTRSQGPESQRTRARADLVFADIREHGMTSMGLWSGDVAHTDNDGHVTLPDLDLALELYKSHGFPKPLFYAPVNLLNTNKVRTSSNYKHYDADVDGKLAAAITRDYTKRAAEAGIPGIVFAPIEEPNLGDGIERGDAPDTRQRIATDLLKSVKGAGGKTAMTCTPDSARVAEGNLDYWLVAYKKFEPGVYAQIQKAKGHAGLYANSTLMGNGTSFSRFFFGMYPWAQRLDLMMAWTYPLLPKRFPENVAGYGGEGPLHVIDGFLGSDGKPVPVIQWELAREGVDDFRYLVTLAHLVETANKSGNAAAHEAASEATAFLGSLRSGISADAHLYSFEDPRTFEPVASAGWDDACFEGTRHRSFELVKKLSSLLEEKAATK